MFDTVGSRLNFLVVAGVEETFRVSFFVGSGGMSVLGATFQAACFRAHGDNAGELVAVLPVEHDCRDNAVLLTVPELEGGHYDWELRATGEDGGECRLLYGTLSVLSSADFEHVVKAAEAASLRELAVQIGGGYAAPLVLRWQACHATVAAAAQAMRAAEVATEAARRLDDVEAAVREFRVFTAQWRDEAARLLVFNPVTGTIWVGNTDTGQAFRGEDGLAPRVNAYGFWEVYVDGQWVTLPERAIGRDGLDGSAVRRVLIGSVEELPDGEELGVMYYVPRDGGYDMWCWLENAGWVCLGRDPYGVATRSSLGLLCLGTDEKVSGGAPVGVDESRHAMVPLASDTVPGTVRASSPVVSSEGGGTHMSVGGSLLVDVATFDGYGALRLGTEAVYVDGAPVGRDKDGHAMVPLASDTVPGAVRLGGLYGADPGEGYRVAVGSYDGELCVGLVPGGALRHWRPDVWSGSGMSWVQGVDWPSEGSCYTCLLTSEQFEQTAEAGLVLREATVERLAGVRLAADADDVREAAVLTAGQAREWYARRDEVCSREDLAGVKADVDACVRKSGSVEEFCVLSMSEYLALQVRNPKCLYLITEE